MERRVGEFGRVVLFERWALYYSRCRTFSLSPSLGLSWDLLTITLDPHPALLTYLYLAGYLGYETYTATEHLKASSWQIMLKLQGKKGKINPYSWSILLSPIQRQI
jgi:hypothetical protein